MKVEKAHQQTLNAMLSDRVMFEALEAACLAYEEYHARKVLEAARQGSEKAAESVHYADCWRGFLPTLMEEAGIRR